MKSRSRQKLRAGVTTVETAIVLSALFLVLFVILDLGVAALRYNVLAAAARRLAREAIVRGENSPPERAAWGPAAYSGTAADDSDIARAAAPWLPTMRGADVAIEVTWPDGEHQEGDLVRVRLTYLHNAVVPFAPSQALTLRTECTMRIVH
jgi:Flp pilus assembly protein TadG